MQVRLLLPLAFCLLLPPPLFAQVIPCVDGMAGDYPCRNVDLLAQPTELGASDIWGWTDPMTGVEYAITFLGVPGEPISVPTIFDLSDPTAPVEVARLTVFWSIDARVYKDHLFVVADFGLPGMLVFDLTRLRGIEDPPASFAPDVVYEGLQGAHNLSINTASGYAYPSIPRGSEGCTGALPIIDVRDPQAPSLAGCFESPDLEGSFHDIHCVTYAGPDPDYTGHEVCFGSAYADEALVILDVTDKADPRLVSVAAYPNAAYPHQGWLTEDSRYFLLNDEADEFIYSLPTRTVVFDVSDLDYPELAFEHFAETTATDHNLFVKGDHVYQANYQAGLRILDLSEIEDGTLTEVAFFDTTPDDSGDYKGAWGVYPFFDSGIVVVSERERGLFVLRPHLDGTVATEGAPQSAPALSVHPNPLSTHATVSLSVEEPQSVTVAVHDALGRRVAVLHEGPVAAGAEHRLTFDGSGLPAGVYVVRALGERFADTRVLTLTR